MAPSIKYISQGNPDEPVSSYDIFEYKYELMTAGGFDKVLYTSPTTIKTKTSQDSHLQSGLKELIPELNNGAEFIVELPPSKAHGNRPHPYYRPGHNVKFHITIVSVE